MKNGRLSFDVGDDHVYFNLFKASKFSSISDECCMIDVVDLLTQETMSNLNSKDSFEHLMMNDSTTNDENPEVALCAQYLEASLQVLPSQAKVKPLSFSLRYEFLGPNYTYSMIINASLNACQPDPLLQVLREHREAIGYTLDDLKGIHPSVCMHRIFMEDDHKP